MQSNFTSRQVAEAAVNKQRGTPGPMFGSTKNSRRIPIRSSPGGIMSKKRAAEIGSQTPQEFQDEINFYRSIPQGLPPGETDRRIKAYRDSHPGTKNASG